MTPGAPRFSVVLPTYNRRDTILRAIQSVRAQTFPDWELVVVDDGSTDDTRELLSGVDGRVRLISQENQGVAGARNTGMAAARGRLIAFLDSDDEMPPHHLALAAAFFDAHPGEDAFTTEFWANYGGERYLKHFRPETADWYPATARRIGSSAFATPPPSGDPYLWFYETRTELGDWARAALGGAVPPEAFHYRGNIFQGWRWGWLMAMQPTVITRRAMEAVGPCDTSYHVASDFGYLAEVCRRYTMNFISVPGCIKHEYTAGKKLPSEGHLVTGRTAVEFHQDVLRFHEELFCKAAPGDPELSALRGFRKALVAKAALTKGARDVALANLEDAARTYPGADTSALLWLARAVPSDRLVSIAYRGFVRAAGLMHKVQSATARLRS